MNDSPMVPYRTLDVDVEGGPLRVGIWGTGGPVILCAHGITATHTEFGLLAQELGSTCRVVAPDLRGRGRSNRITGPWGMAAHAADLVRVLDAVGAPAADVLVGHSMGGFVAAVAAAEHPERFRRVLMVDGGVPLANFSYIAWLPFSDFFVERLIRRIIGPSLARLEMTFESRDAYRAFWRKHPALAADWSPALEAFVDYDLEGEAPALRASTRKDPLLRDVRTQLIENTVPRALKRLRCPVRFLRAERGMFDDKPLYDEAKLRRAAAIVPHFSYRNVEGVNHYTIMMSARGARVAAEEVRALL